MMPSESTEGSKPMLLVTYNDDLTVRTIEAVMSPLTDAQEQALVARQVLVPYKVRAVGKCLISY